MSTGLAAYHHPQNPRLGTQAEIDAAFGAATVDVPIGTLLAFDSAAADHLLPSVAPNRLLDFGFLQDTARPEAKALVVTDGVSYGITGGVIPGPVLLMQGGAPGALIVANDATLAVARAAAGSYPVASGQCIQIVAIV